MGINLQQYRLAVGLYSNRVKQLGHLKHVKLNSDKCLDRQNFLMTSYKLMCVLVLITLVGMTVSVSWLSGETEPSGEQLMQQQEEAGIFHMEHNLMDQAHMAGGKGIIAMGIALLDLFRTDYRLSLTSETMEMLPSTRLRVSSSDMSFHSTNRSSTSMAIVISVSSSACETVSLCNCTLSRVSVPKECIPWKESISSRVKNNFTRLHRISSRVNMFLTVQLWVIRISSACRLYTACINLSRLFKSSGRVTMVSIAKVMGIRLFRACRLSIVCELLYMIRMSMIMVSRTMIRVTKCVLAKLRGFRLPRASRLSMACKIMYMTRSKSVRVCRVSFRVIVVPIVKLRWFRLIRACRLSMACEFLYMTGMKLIRVSRARINVTKKS